MKTKLSFVSIILSFIGIVIGFKISRDIALTYLKSDGKTQALFSIILISFSWRYYFATIGLLALVLSIISVWMKEKKMVVITAIFVSLLSIALNVFDIWRLWV